MVYWLLARLRQAGRTILPLGSAAVLAGIFLTALGATPAAADSSPVPEMAPGTSRAITLLAGGGTETAFQGINSDLFTTGPDGLTDTHLGMMPGTSPSITALSGAQLASGGFETAFQANNSELWTVGAGGDKDWHLGMMAATSPSISGTRDGGFETAFQANTGQLWTVGGASGADSGNWGVQLMPGDSPAVAVQPDNELELTMGGPGGQLLDVRHQMAPAATYVAVGDSYSSGEGAGSYDPASGGCDRSSNSWPQQLANSLQGPNQLTFYQQACSGAKIGDVTAQEQSTVNNSDDLITVTAGGNDAGFGPAMTACVAAGVCGGLTLTNTQASVISGQAFNLYRDIAQRAVHATIVVVGYPDIFPPAANGCAQTGPLTSDNLTAIHSSIQLLNLKLREAVSAVDNGAGSSHQGWVTFFDPNADKSWIGHDVCASQPWANGLHDADHSAGVFHPNVAGNTHLCQQVHNYLFGTPSCTPPATPVQQAGCTPLAQPTEGYAPDPQATDAAQPEVCDWQPSLDDPSQPSEDEPAPDVSSTISYDTCSIDPSAAGCGQATSTITYDICTQYPTAANCPGQPDQAGNPPAGPPDDDPCVIDPTAPGCPFALPDDPAPPDPEAPDTGGADQSEGGGGGGDPFHGDPLIAYEE